MFSADSIKRTEDGSYTVFSSKYGETYHSIHGAETESMKIFIEYGLEFFLKNNTKTSVRIFEVGLGTALNAFLTYRFSKTLFGVEYHAVELYPLEETIFNLIAKEINSTKDKNIFLDIHKSQWDTLVGISENFSINKMNSSLIDVEIPQGIDIVYFDAFSPNVQPELWTLDIFKRIFDKMNNGGVLTTYCAKGQVRRNLKEAGFFVERLEGPPHKREVLRATKPL